MTQDKEIDRGAGASSSIGKAEHASSSEATERKDAVVVAPSSGDGKSLAKTKAVQAKKGKATANKLNASEADVSGVNAVGSSVRATRATSRKADVEKESGARLTRKKLAETPESKRAHAVARRMRVSPQKLNVLVKDVRGLPVSKALALLKFSRRRIAGEARRALLSAVANAEHNKGLDVDALCVAEASVGRALVMKRLDIKGRSRSGRIERPLSHLRIVVAEIE